MAFISNGTTILDNGAFDVSLGGLEFISEATASASASIEFTSGIDSTYDIYKFEMVNIHAATSGAEWQFNLSTDSGSNYNVTKTSTSFFSIHTEDGSTAFVQYNSASDLAQGTGDQELIRNLATDNDCSYSGYLYLFQPSSDTYVKHYINRGNGFNTSPTSIDSYIAGYGNTTSAINAIIFRMSSGNIDAGTIKMYGIKGS